MTRRNLELLLLCIAAPIVIVLFSMMVINGGQELSFNTLGVPIGIFIAFIIAHIAIRKLAPASDPAILPIAFALSGIGIAFITRLAPDMAVRQLMWLYVGIVAMVLILIALRHLDVVANYKYLMMIIGLILLLSPLLPIVGYEVNGSQIWLRFGSLSFQPGELAKIFIVFFLAGYLASHREMLSVFTWKLGPFRLPALSTLLPLLFMWAIALIIVVFEKDLGSALVFFTVFLVMLYVATGKWFYVVVGLVLAGAAVVVLYFGFTHLQTRVSIWLDPFADPTDTGYQLVQGIYSLADGGIFGVGIGRGMATQIPYVENDFIFAAIAEETGLLGAAGVLLLFLCFAIRGILTAARARTDVSSLIAVGLTSIIILQAFIIVGGVTRVIPLTGITLPFISQGGSSLLASFIIVGCLLRCGDEGTGVNSEITAATTSLSANSVLGRVALGKRLTSMMIAFSILFAILVANLTLIMVIQANDYQNMVSNNHTIAREARTERGTISTYDGKVLAQSVLNDDGTYSRVYPAGTLASHIVGYASTQYGTSGIEASLNDTLKGQQNFASWSDAINYLAGINAPGNDVTLTINSSIQQAAQDALSGYTGACVVMDPTTGAVLAMASSPTYNAADVDQVIAEAAQAGSTSEQSSELFNRATQALYAPGSTFKIVTLTTALQDGVATPSTTFNSPGVMDIGNGKVSNIDNISYGNISLAEATEVSSNTVYGQVGVELGPERLVEGANAFAFDQSVDFPLPLAESVMPNPSEMTEWETAWAAAGEPVGEHESPAGPQATVLEMAMSGCAIANKGVLMQPYLVQSIYNANGERSFEATPNTLKQTTDPVTAGTVLDVLEGVVANGSGTAAQISGVTVAGKTGTAERGDTQDDSWFVGIADTSDNNPSVVVSIVLERGGSGLGAQRARNVIRTALQIQGVL